MPAEFIVSIADKYRDREWVRYPKFFSSMAAASRFAAALHRVAPAWRFVRIADTVKGEVHCWPIDEAQTPRL